MAKRLALLNDVDETKAQIAAYLHDITKEKDIEEQKKEIILNYGEKILNEYPIALYHALTGALFAKSLGLDEEISSAIMYHPCGKPNMTKLEQVVFLADYVCEERLYKECIETRPYALASLDLGCYMKLKNITERHKNSFICKYSLEALAYYEKFHGGN